MSAPVVLNQSQELACEKIFDFLLEEDSKCFNLIAPPGYGKTFMMAHIINTILPQYLTSCEILGKKPLYDQVHACATTNPAAEILTASTGIPCSTIHSLLSLTVFNDFKTGKTKLKKAKGAPLIVNSVIIVDEGSMIDSELLTQILERTFQCKIIFLSDDCQLPPVMEKSSKIYRMGYPEAFLTIPMRNAESKPLMELCSQLRDTVKSGVFTPIKPVPGIIDFFGSEIENVLVEHFVSNSTNSRICTYTNERSIEYNNYIRESRGLPEYLTEGEILTNNSIYKSEDKTISIDSPVTLLNFIGYEDVFLNASASINVAVFDIGCKAGIIHKAHIPTDKQHYADLLKYFSKEKDWPTYFRLKEQFLDLRGKDASTTHKAQGGSFDNVFIDLTNLCTCRDPRIFARLLYVAVSRARKRVIFYGDMSEKYGGMYE